MDVEPADELDGCPFCGSPAEVEKVAGSDDCGWLVVCTRKPTCASLLEETRDGAIALWNTRPARMEG